MRNHIIIGGAIVVAISLGVAVFGISKKNANTSPVISTQQEVAAVAVPFTELTRGAQSKVLNRTNYLITSADELTELWSMIDAKGKLPTVDFNTSAVAAVFAGEKPTGGYTASVSKVEDASERTVIVELTKPGENCVLMQTKTAPYQVIIFAKTSLPLGHEDLTTTTECTE